MTRGAPGIPARTGSPMTCIPSASTAHGGGSGVDAISATGISTTERAAGVAGAERCSLRGSGYPTGGSRSIEPDSPHAEPDWDRRNSPNRLTPTSPGNAAERQALPGQGDTANIQRSMRAANSTGLGERPLIRREHLDSQSLNLSGSVTFK